MQAITLCDWVSLSFSDRDQLTCSDPSIPTDHQNLAFQALALFRKKTNLTLPIHIHIDKHIPIQAGLGGGSSNAATVLYGLKCLFNSSIHHETLKDWSVEIGSDIPFFFSSGTALCTGLGEHLKSENLPSRLPQWIAKPKKLSLSTPAVYSECQIGESLEPAAFRVCPRLSIAKDQLLKHGFSDVFMTGSGSAFLCYGNQPVISDDFIFYPFVPIRKKEGAWYTSS